MSCSHGWHDCPPCGPGPYARWGYPGWMDEPHRFGERGGRGPRRRDPGMAAEELEARLEELHRMVRGIERELEGLRRPREDAAT